MTTRRALAELAGVKSRNKREAFLDTVATFGPASKQAQAALTVWGKAHEAMLEAVEDAIIEQLQS